MIYVLLLNIEYIDYGFLLNIEYIEMLVSIL